MLIDSIAQVERQKLYNDKSRSSFISDGYTDASSIEQEMFLVQYVINVKYVATQPIDRSAGIPLEEIETEWSSLKYRLYDKL